MDLLLKKITKLWYFDAMRVIALYKEYHITGSCLILVVETRSSALSGTDSLSLIVGEAGGRVVQYLCLC